MPDSSMSWWRCVPSFSTVPDKGFGGEGGGVRWQGWLAGMDGCALAGGEAGRIGMGMGGGMVGGHLQRG